MTEAELCTYLEAAVPAYAIAKTEGEGLSKEDALKVAEESFRRLLPEGVNSANQFLFSVQDQKGSTIGTLWFAKKQERGKISAFVYDINLLPESRGKGLGRELMGLLEAETRRLGFERIGLHVFGYNKRAIHLYEDCGFETTNRIMEKLL
jgi:ribosomal protein S18 acetylase RimI-like enzyme